MAYIRSAQHRQHLVTRDPLGIKRFIEHAAVIHQQRRLGLDCRAHPRRSNRQPGQQILQSDQQQAAAALCAGVRGEKSLSVEPARLSGVH